MSPVTRWWVRMIVLLFVGAGTLVLAYHLRDILNPLLAALAIAYALNPLVVKLSQSTFFGKPLGRTGATVLIFLGFLGAFGTTLAIAIPMVGREVADLAGDMAGETAWDADALLEAIEEGEFEFVRGSTFTGKPATQPPAAADLATFAAALTRGGLPLTREQGTGSDGAPVALDRWFIDHDGNGAHDVGYLEILEDKLSSATGAVLTRINADSKARDELQDLRASATDKLQARSGEIAATGFSVVGWVGSALAESARAMFVMLSILILIPFYTFFFMRGLDQAAARAIPYIPAAIRPKTVRICTRIHLILSAFIRGRAFIAIVVSVMAWIGFWACGVPYALVLGVLVGITIMVPFLPVVVAVIPACLLLLAEGRGFGPVAGVIIVYAIIQTVEGFVLTPRVLGEEGDMHPVTAFVALFVGAELLGLLGAMLAIPLAAAVKIIAHELLMPELKEVAGMGPGTETGKTMIAINAAKMGVAGVGDGHGLVGGGGLVPHPLDAKDGAPGDGAGSGGADLSTDGDGDIVIPDDTVAEPGATPPAPGAEA